MRSLKRRSAGFAKSSMTASPEEAGSGSPASSSGETTRLPTSAESTSSPSKWTLADLTEAEYHVLVTYGYCNLHHLLPEPDDRLEVLHSALARYADRFDPARSKVTTYFAWAFHGMTLSLLRQRRTKYRRAERLIESETFDLLVSEAATPIIESDPTLWLLLRELSRRQRYAVRAIILRGQTVKAVAERWQACPMTVRNNLDKALTCLRGRLERAGRL